MIRSIQINESFIFGNYDKNLLYIEIQLGTIKLLQ